MKLSRWYWKESLFFQIKSCNRTIIFRSLVKQTFQSSQFSILFPHTTRKKKKGKTISSGNISTEEVLINLENGLIHLSSVRNTTKTLFYIIQFDQRAYGIYGQGGNLFVLTIMHMYNNLMDSLMVDKYLNLTRDLRKLLNMKMTVMLVVI